MKSKPTRYYFSSEESQLAFQLHRSFAATEVCLLPVARVSNQQSTMSLLMSIASWTSLRNAECHLMGRVTSAATCVGKCNWASH